MQVPLPDRYNVENARRLLRDPSLVREEVTNLKRSTARSVQNARFGYRHGEPFDLMAEDWDNLIILDACRLDSYRAQTPFDGTVEGRLSCGSGTTEFLSNTFEGQQYHDTVYVTANLHVSALDSQTFHAVNPLKHEWNTEFGTVLPEAVSEAARDASERFPRKRLVVHYIQPHTPHLGETARRLMEETALGGGYLPDDVEGSDGADDSLLIWELAKENVISLETLRQSYRETLDFVLEDVQELVPDLDGRTVVTTDHGEMLGERLLPFCPREFAHTVGLLTEELRCVPWQVVADGERRRIEADPPVEQQSLNEETREQRLRALGYAD